ncbi:4-alpha-glucanotransferase [Candidatus Gottesmanbacteria bacterium]|nr:4-alpha-glucanotransferase [Candidatus Gottesmanbacteria bacterium]
MTARLGTMLPFNSLYSGKSLSYFDRAKLFIDWLHKTNQQCWQVLPLHPTSYKKQLDLFYSPYSSYGVGLNPQFLSKKESDAEVDIDRFLKEHDEWIYDYALFVALSRDQETDKWVQWNPRYRNAGSPETADFYKNHSGEINEIIREQAVLHHYYNDLLRYAELYNVQIWGDIPFYLELHTPLVWKYQSAFSVGVNGNMEYVAGSRGGEHFGKRQVWGFPLYKYDPPESLGVMQRLWDVRIRYAARLYRMARLDAAVRFFAYEKLHATNPHMDTREKTPFPHLFAHVVSYSRKLGMDVYIEDVSGLDMTRLHREAASLDVAGISVASMLLAKGKLRINPKDFDSGKYKKNHIFFSSTHDTEPLVSYLESLTQTQQDKLARVFGLKHKLRRVTHASASLVLAGEIREFLKNSCNTLIVPMQDWLLSRERINVPGVISSNNWNYKMPVDLENLQPITGKKRLVCFDLDGVIVFRRTTFGEHYLLEHGDKSEELGLFFRSVYPQCLIGKKNLKTELNKNLRAFGWEGTAGELMRQWFTVECERIDGTLLTFTQTLHDLGVKSIICSDQEKYRSVYLTGILGKWFSGKYFSWKLGYRKHHQAFWIGLLSRVHVLPQEIIFIDNEITNLNAAASAGITGICYAGDISAERLILKAVYSPETRVNGLSTANTLS